LPGIEVYGYDIAPDGSQLVAGSIAAEGKPEIWLVPLDRRSPPRRLEVGEAWSPWFGPTGEIFMRRRGSGSEDRVFVWSAGSDEMLAVLDTPIQELVGVSPDGQWLVVLLPAAEGKAFGQLAAIPRNGGSPRPICANCFVNWVPGGRYLYVFWFGTDHRGMEDVRTILVDLADGPSLPPFPPGGVEHNRS
jgi:hypothetical protein